MTPLSAWRIARVISSGFLFAYVCAAFVCWNPNPAQWADQARLAAVMAALAIMFFAFMVLAVNDWVDGA